MWPAAGTSAYPPRDAGGRLPAAPGARRDRPRVGAHRLHRVRWPAGAHRAVPAPVRRAAPMAERARVRAGRGRDQPVAGTRLHPARHLFGLAPSRHGGSAPRRALLHPARPRPDARALGAVPVGLAARLAARGRHGCRRGGAGGRGARGVGPRDPDLAPHGAQRARARSRLRPGRGARGGPRWRRGSCSCCSPAAPPSSPGVDWPAPARACTPARPPSRSRQAGARPC